MRIFATIAEYNPFHNGHLYHINHMKKNGADAVVAVMSGNFVQRAEPAIADKFSRARAAVQCGADLILELPVRYSLASAEKFAQGGIDILAALGCVDTFCCGSESGDESKLRTASDALTDPAFADILKKKLAQNPEIPFAKARQLALHELGITAPTTPNDILATEYLKALKYKKSSMQFTVLKRQGSYHPSNESGFAGAAEIRQKLTHNQNADADMPAHMAQALQSLFEQEAAPAQTENGQRALIAFMRTVEPQILAQTAGAQDGLWQRVLQAAKSARSIEELYATAKTKRFTMSAVRRLVFSAFLGLKKDDTPIPYIRVLAANRRGAEVLAAAKKTACLPVIHTLTAPVCKSGTGLLYASEELRAADLYGIFQPQIGCGSRELTVHRRLL